MQKTTLRHVVSCFYNLSRTVSQVLMSLVDKLT